MLKSAIWWTTMACNFKYKYCWEVQARERGEFKPWLFHPAQNWLEAWNRLRPQLLDITGGEPFLVPDLLDVLTGLDSSIRMAITSNPSHPLLEFVKRVSPERVMSRWKWSHVEDAYIGFRLRHVARQLTCRSRFIPRLNGTK